MKRKLMVGLLLAGGSVFAAPRISAGIQFGAPARVTPNYVEPANIPPCPGPDYVFVNGYWQHRAPVVVHRDRDDRREQVRRDFDRRDFDRRDFDRR